MKKLFALVIIVAATYGGWRAWRGPAEADRGHGQDLFYGRAWLDHLPTSRTEKFHEFGTSKKNPFGWFAERSTWKGEWESFRYERRGDGKLEILLPHSEQKLQLTYRAWKCKENDFDYCLELSGVEGPKKYYSRRGWERNSLDDSALEEEILTTVGR